MFETEKFLNKVFEACCTASNENPEFNAEEIIQKIYNELGVDEERFFKQKNATDGLTFLERMKLIKGRIQPEFTEHNRFLKQVRYGRLTKAGAVFKFCPNLLRNFVFFIFLQKSRFLAFLGVLAFIKLGKNAYGGAIILSGWLEYLAAGLMFYLLYLGFKKLLT